MNLRLVEDPSGEKEKDPRPPLIHAFNKAYEAKLGLPNPLPWGKCMNAMYHFKTTDIETGEVYYDYPSADAWQRQLEAFFQDRFAGDQRGYGFFFFLSQYGNFFVRASSKPAPKFRVSTPCEYCGKHDHLSANCPTLVPMPPDVAAALKSFGSSARSPVAVNEEYRCQKCGEIHSPNKVCG